VNTADGAAEGIVSNFAADVHLGTNTKRSQIAFAVKFVALCLGRLTAQLLGDPAQSLMNQVTTLFLQKS